MKKLKASFEIEGTMLAEDVPLTAEMLERGIQGFFDVERAGDYWLNRDIDTKVYNITIEEV